MTLDLLKKNGDPANNLAHLIEFQGVSYKPSDPSQRPIIDNIDFYLKPGEIVTLLGPNGAGKSTFAKLVLGIYPPSSGKVVRQGNLSIGYMPQKISFDPSLPLNTHYLLKMAPSKPCKSRIEESLELVGASHLLSRDVHKLSGGELQRVLLARALLINPDLLVLDEPTQGVDVVGQKELYALITQIQKEKGCAILLISHDLHLVMGATDRVICLNRHICCSGHPGKVGLDPAYRQLFGEQAAAQLAIYSHEHNHKHPN